MKTKTINVYSFNELSEEAKQNALQDFCNTGQYFWADENAESLREFANVFPVNVINWQYGGGGKYISHSLTCEESIENLSGPRLRTYLLNNYYSVLFERKPYGKYFKSDSGVWKYPKRSNIFYIQTSCPFTGYCMDESLLQPIRDFINKPDNSTFSDLIDECLNNWLNDCESDYDYFFSLEYYSEHCEANNYEFDECGNMI